MQTRPLDVVAVETNWVLDVTLHQDEGAEELLTQTEHGVVQTAARKPPCKSEQRDESLIP